MALGEEAQRAGDDHSMSQIGDRRNSGTIRRIGEGEERRRTAVLQGTMSIAVADFGIFVQGDLVEGQ